MADIPIRVVYFVAHFFIGTSMFYKWIYLYNYVHVSLKLNPLLDGLHAWYVDDIIGLYLYVHY